jgi:hypothetical protein
MFNHQELMAKIRAISGTSAKNSCMDEEDTVAVDTTRTKPGSSIISKFFVIFGFLLPANSAPD